MTIMIVFYCHNVFAFLTLEDANYDLKENKTFDYENTYADLNTSPNYVFDGKLVIIGDSYSFLLAANCGYKVNYIVHQGYTISQIYDNLLREIKPNSFKYALVFIGPNDFIMQTQILDFKMTIINTGQELIKKGIIPMFTTYMRPRSDIESKVYPKLLDCNAYNVCLEDAVKTYNYLWFDLTAYSNLYGLDETDGIHPSIGMYKPLYEGVVSYLQDVDKYIKDTPKN